MRNYIIKGLLLFSSAALTIVSCDNEDADKSVITSFEKYTIDAVSTPVIVDESVITEDADTVVLEFSIDDRQSNDVALTVGVGASSTATEGVDFDLITHTVDLLAFQGQDGFTVEVVVYEDYVPEAGDEEIYLTFTGGGPNGVDVVETALITIEDSGLIPQPAPTVDLTLRWEFDAEELAEVDPCDLINDYDLSITTSTTNPYSGDRLAGAMSSLSCPEEGTLTLAGMVDGTVYNVWIVIYGGLDLGPVDPEMTVYIDFARENSEFNGTASVEGVFDATQDGVGGIMFTIERNGDVITLKDSEGETVAEGRKSSTSTGKRKLESVERPF